MKSAKNHDPERPSLVSFRANFRVSDGMHEHRCGVLCWGQAREPLGARRAAGPHGRTTQGASRPGCARELETASPKDPAECRDRGARLETWRAQNLTRPKAPTSLARASQSLQVRPSKGPSMGID
jgi:hypothetical protein